MKADTPPQADRYHVPDEEIRGAIESILAGLTATLLGVPILWAAKNGYEKIFDFWMPHHVRHDRHVSGYSTLPNPTYINIHKEKKPRASRHGALYS
jgi:hypothetical protein